MFKFIRPRDAIMCCVSIHVHVRRINILKWMFCCQIDVDFICMMWRKCCAIRAWKKCGQKQNYYADKKTISISLLFNALLFLLLIFNSIWICRTINFFKCGSQRFSRNNIVWREKKLSQLIENRLRIGVTHSCANRIDQMTQSKVHVIHLIPFCFIIL